MMTNMSSLEIMHPFFANTPQANALKWPPEIE